MNFTLNKHYWQKILINKGLWLLLNKVSLYSAYTSDAATTLRRLDKVQVSFTLSQL